MLTTGRGSYLVARMHLLRVFFEPLLAVLLGVDVDDDETGLTRGDADVRVRVLLECLMDDGDLIRCGPTCVGQLAVFGEGFFLAVFEEDWENMEAKPGEFESTRPRGCD